MMKQAEPSGQGRAVVGHFDLLETNHLASSAAHACIHVANGFINHTLVFKFLLTAERTV